MADRQFSTRRGGAWTKVVIFISLYALLLLCLIEWVLALYLYGNKHVDSKMAPSLILILIASFCTVPLVTLHSFLAWQYNAGLGSRRQRVAVYTACTYILRLTITIWLAASVAGLVVISQHASCLPDGVEGGFWKVGVSCALHRASVIVSVFSFLTVCLYFCSRELCERPYDVSLLGVYKPHRSIRGKNSISSTSSMGSEESLKKDILCICRHPDVTYGTRTPYMPSIHSTSEKSTCTPSIQHPTPIRPASFLQLGTDPDAGLAEHLSGTTLSAGSTLPGRHPSDVSCTPTVMTARALETSHAQALPELPDLSELKTQPNHKRHKSSISSLRKFLPNAFPTSLSLSDDPQIRALADPSTQIDIEKQVVPQIEVLQPLMQHPVTPRPGQQQQQRQPHEMPENAHVQSTNSPPMHPQPRPSLPRSATMNSAEAPEVVTPAPLNVRKSNTTSQTTIPVPGAAYFPPPQPLCKPQPTPPQRRPANSSSWATLLDSTRPTRMHTMRTIRHQTKLEPLLIPRYTQSQRYPRSTRRLHTPRGLVRNRNDRTDVELLYPSTRRPRSTTCGGVTMGHLDCIRETGQSIDEPPSSENTYRGANRTSMHGY